jgi:hypothetical protein
VLEVFEQVLETCVQLDRASWNKRLFQFANLNGPSKFSKEKSRESEALDLAEVQGSHVQVWRKVRSSGGQERRSGSRGV